MGKYKDYIEIVFDENWKRYNIGDSCNLQLIAEETLFHASKDCLVKFLDSIHDESEPVEVLIPEGLYLAFSGDISAISIKRKLIGGLLQIWSEGSKLVQL
jgi:hypothetical protein